MQTLFSPEAACEVKEAERHSDVFHEAEPDVWMVMVHHSLFTCYIAFHTLKENQFDLNFGR